MKMEQSVPKRRHTKLRRQGITQRKAYNIQNTAKVWNQEIKTRFVFSNFIPQKSCRLWDNVEKYGRSGQATDETIIGRRKDAILHVG